MPQLSLSEAIEQQRYKLNKIFRREPNNTEKLLQASQELDELINQYYRGKRSK